MTDLLAYQLTLHYDPSWGSLAEVVPAVAVDADAGWALVVNAANPGVVELVGYGVTPVNGVADLVTLRFQGVRAGSNAANPVVAAVKLNEVLHWINQQGSEPTATLRYRHLLPLVVK